MIVDVYIVILCLSAGGAVWLLLQAAHILIRILGLTRFAAPSGTIILGAILAFWMVASAPPAVLMGALLLFTCLLAAEYGLFVPFCRWLAPLFLVGLGQTTLQLPPVTEIKGLALTLITLGGWYGFTLSGRYLVSNVTRALPGLIACLLPILAAPVIFEVPSWLALDAMIMLAAFAGAALTRRWDLLWGYAKLPLAYLIGWLILDSALRGAPIAAGISLLAWLGSIAYGRSQESPPPSSPTKPRNAFDF